jgi:hypothetical protein
VNFQKVVSESDPKALKHFKHIAEVRPIKVISKDDSEKGEIGAECPLVVSCLRFQRRKPSIRPTI